MKRIRIIHNTEYHYHTPVAFGPHRALLRPREGHDVHIDRAVLEVEPKADIRWLRDIYGNSIAVFNFTERSRKLRVFSEINVDHYEDNPLNFDIEPGASRYPFQYPSTEQVELILYRLPSYPYDGPALQSWLSELYRPGQLIGTFELLNKLNTRIFDSFRYARREESGVQLPCQTLALQSGSCRDYAVLMMEAARHLGFGARFVTGYIQMGEGQHGATHAWAEIYLPGSGWRGFDPTNNKLVGFEHVSVAVAAEHIKASPLSGTWEGPKDAFDRMEVSVQVVSS
jgi:transglutaminase-like putative cysteine protease